MSKTKRATRHADHGAKDENRQSSIPEPAAKILSYGGGVQPFALAILAAHGAIDYDTLVFANVGNDSEHPDSLRHIHEIQKPYIETAGLHFVELQPTKRTLLQHIQQSQRTIPIPVVLPNTAHGRRTCTVGYKIKVVDRYIRKILNQKTYTVGLGISMDEFQRARSANDDRMPHRTRDYPLLNLRLSRDDCKQIILNEGLSIPPKSACWFCPFQKRQQWQTLHDDHPELFRQAIELEQTMQARRVELGRDTIWLSKAMIPLSQLCTNEQASFDFDDVACESGYCMT